MKMMNTSYAYRASGSVRNLTSTANLRAVPSSRAATRCMAASSLTIQPETPYAVISIGGVKQYVEEGMSFFTPSSASFMVMDVALKGTVQFKTVLALKSDGTLVKGTRSKPYVTDALVEGELLEDEFRVMETRLKKIKVTKITRTSTAATLSNKAQ